MQQKITRLRLFIALFMMFSFVNITQARHIIGGVMTYECRGNGRYDFVLKMYRDDLCTTCAAFDPLAYIGVYRCTGGNCNLLTQRDFVARQDVPIRNVRFVNPPDYPCLIPPNVRVQEAVYEFSLVLPISNDSYHVSYQRCCRNITINNIINPDEVGATYTIEITAEAQRVCNNSPVFNDFPPIIICAGAPLVFDHSATDKDGDQLIYEFCDPLAGGAGGNRGLNPLIYPTCEGAYPNPACPPPYDRVTFRAPNFTAIAPLGYRTDNGQPILRINPNTGLITGTPELLGQFVVGVCVSEYRNGVLLSRVFRDFQFNVASCDPQVEARVRADEVIGGRQFLINSCGATSVAMQNQSFQERFIRQWEWRFDIAGEQRTFSAWNPTIEFPGVGQYRGQLLLNPGTDCGDTAQVFINIFPSIDADFTFEYDTCVAGPVFFTDRSVSGSGQITSWDWDFGDGNKGTVRNPSHIYREPGDIPVSLTVRDINRCQDTQTYTIPYYPVPALLVISPSSFTGCVPASIFFDNLSFPIDDTYDIRWTFGDGGTGTAISPTHTYEVPGIYTVSLEITSPIGCKTDTIFNNLITMLPSPEAGFSFSPDQPSNLNPVVSFTDQSNGASNWLWDFGYGGANSTLRNPVHTFPDTGMYEVRQIVIHPSGCRDTLIRIVDVIPEVRYFLPNAFTPNNDALNDIYKGVGVLDGIRSFKMSIWNRWGELIFETTNPDEGWNGRKFNSGKDAPIDVYVVVVTFTGPRGDRFEYKTFATLVR